MNNIKQEFDLPSFDVEEYSLYDIQTASNGNAWDTEEF